MKLTPSQYAKACGVSRQAIFDRINRGTLSVEEITIAGKKYQQIDTEKYPPVKMPNVRAS